MILINEFFFWLFLYFYPILSTFLIFVWTFSRHFFLVLCFSCREWRKVRERKKGNVLSIFYRPLLGHIRTNGMVFYVEIDVAIVSAIWLTNERVFQVFTNVVCMQMHCTKFIASTVRTNRTDCLGCFFYCCSRLHDWFARKAMPLLITRNALR